MLLGTVHRYCKYSRRKGVTSVTTVHRPITNQDWYRSVLYRYYIFKLQAFVFNIMCRTLNQIETLISKVIWLITEPFCRKWLNSHAIFYTHLSDAFFPPQATKHCEHGYLTSLTMHSLQIFMTDAIFKMFT